MTEKKPVIFAFTGKGGVGKTSLSAQCVRLLSENFPDKKVLAIDADPAIGLATALGVEVGSTVDDIRKMFVETAEEGDKKAAIEMLSEAKFRLVDAMVEEQNISFLAIGRPESAGCYCKVNAYLKEIISSIADNYDYVVIDGEAGIEQVNRRVMEEVTNLVLVSDASKKGLGVVRTIQMVAEELTMADNIGLIINRIPSAVDPSEIDTEGLKVLAMIGDDPGMAMADMRGDSAFSAEKDAPVVNGMRRALEEMGIL